MRDISDMHDVTHSDVYNKIVQKKYVFHMIDTCLWNLYCLYKLKTNKTISIAKFQLKLADQIFKKYQKRTTCHPITPGKNYPVRDSMEDIFLHLMKLQEKIITKMCCVCEKL